MDDQTISHTFESAEAQYEFEKARRMRLVVRTALGLLFLAGFGYGMYRLGGGGSACADGHEGHDHGAGDAGTELETLAIPPAGAPDGKVRVVCILPKDATGEGCHAPVVTFLTDLAETHAPSTYVQFQSMKQFGEERLKREYGDTCAAVLINDKVEFTLTIDGEPANVRLMGTTPTHYSLEDIGEAIAQVYESEYGPIEGTFFEVPEGQGRDDSPSARQPLRPPKGDDGTPLTMPRFRGVDAPAETP